MEKELIVYVDMDDVICNYSKSYRVVLKNNPDIRYPQSQYGFFRNLKPMPNAVESMEYLYNHPNCKVYILTAPSYKNPLCYSEKREWVETHLGIRFVKRLIISPNKGLSRGDYLIDDNDKGKGQETFEGKLIRFGSYEFPDWKSVIKYLDRVFRKLNHEG